MGRYDDISDARLRYEVQRFARILQRMEAKDEVLDRTADILTLLGELRRMVFAWEVRSTFRGGDDVEDAGEGSETEASTPPESLSERIVREALEQASDFVDELGPAPDADDDPRGPPPDRESGPEGTRE